MAWPGQNGVVLIPRKRGPRRVAWGGGEEGPGGCGAKKYGGEPEGWASQNFAFLGHSAAPFSFFFLSGVPSWGRGHGARPWGFSRLILREPQHPKSRRGSQNDPKEPERTIGVGTPCTVVLLSTTSLNFIS